jgi:hypothetical protein
MRTAQDILEALAEETSKSDPELSCVIRRFSRFASVTSSAGICRVSRDEVSLLTQYKLYRKGRESHDATSFVKRNLCMSEREQYLHRRLQNGMFFRA